MSADPADLGSFDGTARLFPLPNVVLFPHVMLPLHIFEPRYRQMTADALAGDRLICMALLRPGWGADYDGCPAIYPTACLGRILAEQRLGDGRFNLLLRGVARVRLRHELPLDRPYRRGRVEVLPEGGEPPEAVGVKMRRELGRHVRRWFGLLGLGTDQLQTLLKSGPVLGPLCDVLGFTLPLDVAFKQSLLEELDVVTRARRLIDHLAANSPPKAGSAAGRPFPPPFSSN
jgi:Lon protease-like protein